jgi:dTDP-D-glucose 4,6-dehydratase
MLPGDRHSHSPLLLELEVYKEVVRGLQAVIVNPSGIVGPWDFKPSLLGKTIIEFAQGKMRASVPGGFDFTPVQDVVQGHLLAMEKGVVGERYLLTGEQLTINETLRGRFIKTWSLSKKVPQASWFNMKPAVFI